LPARRVRHSRERERGIMVDLDAEVHPNGRFTTLSDPEGNPIQLWQPV
jgi:glyoxylase I family protein